MASKSMFKSATSSSPDEFATGAPDKFTGVIRSVLAYPYVGKQSTTGKYFLWVGVSIEPDEDSGYEPFTEKFFAGYLNKGVPSKNDETPAGGDDEFYLNLSKGEESLETSCVSEDGHIIEDHAYVGRYIIGQPDKNLNWHQFLLALRESDEKGIVDLTSPGYDLSRFHNLKCRFDRVPQESSGSQKSGKQQQQSFPVLVPTKVFGYVEKSGKAKSAAASKSSSSKSAAVSSDNGSEDLESRIVDGVLSALKEAGGKLKKGVLITKVSKGFDKSERGDVMAWIGENSNLVDIEGTEFDLDELTLELS